MEERDRFVFLVRPRRMGKSLFVETLKIIAEIQRQHRNWLLRGAKL